MFLRIYSRKEEDWRFIEEDVGDYAAETIGCGCCSSNILLTKEILQKNITKLEEILIKQKKILEEMS